MLALDSTLDSTPSLALLPPLFIVLDLMVAFYLIQDLYDPKRRVNSGNKTVWLFIILFGSVFGCLAYFLFGREG